MTQEMEPFTFAPSVPDGRDVLCLQVIDDDPLVRAGCATILERIAAASNPPVQVQLLLAETLDDAIKLHAKHPDIALTLLDLNLSDSKGAQTLKKFRALLPAARVAVISCLADEGTIRTCFEAGASGYMLKLSSIDLLQEAIRFVLAGGTFVPKEVLGLGSMETAARPRNLRASDVPVEIVTDRSSYDMLTDREKQVFALVVSGLSNKAIARQLLLTPGTVRNYVSKILQRFCVRTRTDLIVSVLVKETKKTNP